MNDVIFIFLNPSYVINEERLYVPVFQSYYVYQFLYATHADIKSIDGAGKYAREVLGFDFADLFNDNGFSLKVTVDNVSYDINVSEEVGIIRIYAQEP